MRNIRLEVLRRVTAFLLVFFIVGIGFGLSGCSSKKDNQAGTVGSAEVQSTAVADDMASLVYQGEPYVVINDNTQRLMMLTSRLYHLRVTENWMNLEDVLLHLLI